MSNPQEGVVSKSENAGKLQLSTIISGATNSSIVQTTSTVAVPVSTLIIENKEKVFSTTDTSAFFPSPESASKPTTVILGAANTSVPSPPSIPTAAIPILSSKPTSTVFVTSTFEPQSTTIITVSSISTFIAVPSQQSPTSNSASQIRTRTSLLAISPPTTQVPAPLPSPLPSPPSSLSSSTTSLSPPLSTTPPANREAIQAIPEPVLPAPVIQSNTPIQPVAEPVPIQSTSAIQEAPGGGGSGGNPASLLPVQPINTETPRPEIVTSVIQPTVIQPVVPAVPISSTPTTTLDTTASSQLVAIATSVSTSDVVISISNTPTAINQDGTVTDGQAATGQPLASQSAEQQPGVTGVGSPNTGTSSNTSDGLESKPRTAVIVGGAVGAIAAVTLIVFLLWFWRKRVIRNRRGSLLTPLTDSPNMEKRGEGMLQVNTDSGNTPSGIQQLTAMLNVVRPGKTVESATGPRGAGINMNRGNSQFLEAATLERSNGPQYSSKAILANESFQSWPSKVLQQGHLNAAKGQPPQYEAFAVSGIVGKNASLGSQGYRNGLDSLQQDIVARAGNSNPFSDTNVVANPSSLVGNVNSPKPSNPFADSDWVNQPLAVHPGPERRTRGQSLSVLRSSQSPIVTPRIGSVRRESSQSVDSFAARRNKFRSDQFDLELGNPLAPSLSNIAEMPRSHMYRASSKYSMQTSHVHRDSYSSRYTSGVSFEEWNDPGPDVGLVPTARLDSPTLTISEWGGKPRSHVEPPNPVGRAL